MDSLAQMIYDFSHDGDQISFREKYSGRGMMGRSCIAVVCHESQFRRFLSDVMTNMVTELVDIVRDAFWQDALDKLIDHETVALSAINTLMSYQQDGMGLQTVYYWPTLEWQGEPVGEQYEVGLTVSDRPSSRADFKDHFKKA